MTFSLSVDAHIVSVMCVISQCWSPLSHMDYDMKLRLLVHCLDVFGK